MAINFDPIPQFDAGDFLGEFPASQVDPLVDAFNRIVDHYNANLECIIIKGTAKYLAERVDSAV